MGPLPESRFNRKLYYHPDKGVQGKSYSDVGGLVSQRPGPPAKYAAASPDFAIERLLLRRREELADLERNSREMIEALTPAFAEGQKERDPLEYIEVLRREYVWLARAKGLRERNVIINHALKNARITVITVVGLEFGALISGSIIVGALCGMLGARVTLRLFEGADHSFHVPAKSGRTDAEIMAQVRDTFAAWAQTVASR